MNGAFLDVCINAGAAAATHIGIVNEVGTPIGARQAVSWTAPAGDGLIRPTADKVFAVTGGTTVAGWRAYSALSGGTDYGGEDFTGVAFGNDGEFTLRANLTAIDIDAV